MDVDGVDARVSSNRAGIVVHRGLRLTDPTRTFLDLAEDLDLVELVVLGDSLVSAGRVTPAALASASATPGRHRRLARRVLPWCVPGSTRRPRHAPGCCASWPAFPSPR